MSEQIQLKGISSMATKAVLAELTKRYEEQTGVQVQIESVGGVDAAKRVQNAENFDMVLLGSDAIDRLIASGCVIKNSRHDWVLSPVAIAIKTGAPHASIKNASEVKACVLSATSISYSTGPSGVYLEKLFESWSIAELVKSKLVVPPPGTPVGGLVASGQVDLGFQQLSELISVQGIDLLGTLPEDIAYITTFSAGIPSVIAEQSQRLGEVKKFMEFLSSSSVEDIKEQFGMTGLGN